VKKNKKGSNAAGIGAACACAGVGAVAVAFVVRRFRKPAAPGEASAAPIDPISLEV